MAPGSLAWSSPPHYGPAFPRSPLCLLLTIYSGSMNGSFTATTFTPFSMQARSTKRPMRPKLSRDKGGGGCAQNPRVAGRGGDGRERDNRGGAL